MADILLTLFILGNFIHYKLLNSKGEKVLTDVTTIFLGCKYTDIFPLKRNTDYAELLRFPLVTIVCVTILLKQEKMPL